MSHQMSLIQNEPGSALQPNCAARAPEDGGSAAPASTAPAAQSIDAHRLTMEGFRTIALLATFLAGLQAQMLSASLSDNSTIPARLVNAFWLAGVFLDVFGAVLAILTARWFELLSPEHIEIFHQPRSRTTVRHLLGNISTLNEFFDWIIAKALFSGLGTVSAGVVMFLIGLVIYVWEKQPLLVSIISSIPVAILSPLVAAIFFYPHTHRRADIVQILAEARGAW